MQFVNWKQKWDDAFNENGAEINSRGPVALQLRPELFGLQQFSPCKDPVPHD